jgi:ABC-2 type transport system ATP-binding protein
MSIIAKRISKYYGDQKALNRVSFNITKGEIVGFLGPNGAGKSTMMKILTGYIYDYKGYAKINFKNVKNQTLRVQKAIGYLPENNPLYLDMYVREFLKFMADIYGRTERRIEKVIALTNLEKEAHKKINQLSKGYRQRVGLAAALINDPDILILDEPTTGLDPNQLVEIRALIKSLSKNKTILLSTHIMQEVEAICDRVIIIDKGTIVADELIEDLRTEHKQTIDVEFDMKVELEAMRKLKYIDNVSEIGLFHYELVFDTDEDMRGQVFDFSHDMGLKIKTLFKRHQSLEELFRNLTQEK